MADGFDVDRRSYPGDTAGVSVQILLVLTGFLALVVLVIFVMSDGISSFTSFGRCAKYETVPVESVIPKLSYPSYSQTGLQCSAQLAVPHDGTLIRVVLEADCPLGLDVAENTKFVDNCYRQLFGSWRIS